MTRATSSPRRFFSSCVPLVPLVFFSLYILLVCLYAVVDIFVMPRCSVRRLCRFYSRPHLHATYTFPCVKLCNPFLLVTKPSPPPGPRRRQALAAARPSPPPGPRRRQALAAARPSPPPGPRRRQTLAAARARRRQALAAARPAAARPSPPPGPPPPGPCPSLLVGPAQFLLAAIRPVSRIFIVEPCAAFDRFTICGSITCVLQ